MKTKLMLFVLIIVSICFIIMSRPIQNELWRFAAFFNPRLSEQLNQEWKNKANAFLLNKLNANNFMEAGVAADILIEKRDKTLIPKFIELLKSKNIKTVGTAIEALGKIGDPKIIAYLMEFVKKGPESVHYRTALLALSEIKYEPIIPEIITLSETKIKNDYRPQQYAIAMMANFDDPELERIIKEFSNDKSPYIRISANHALEQIEERRKASNDGQKTAK